VGAGFPPFPTLTHKEIAVQRKCKYFIVNEDGVRVCSVCGKPAHAEDGQQIEDKNIEQHEDKRISPTESKRGRRPKKRGE